MWIDRAPVGPLARGPRRRAAATTLLWALAGAGCGPQAADGGPAAPAGTPGTIRAVRVIHPRGTPRSTIEMRLEATLVSSDHCELVVHVRSPRGGDAHVEFSLPEGAAGLGGALGRECPLEAGVIREERLLVSVPAAGHALLGVAVVLDGRREEAYAEIGEPPRAEESGLRVRSSSSGEPVLRIGPEDLGR